VEYSTKFIAVLAIDRICKIGGFLGMDYEDYHLQEYDSMYSTK
jgi:hypothetical protein